MSVKHTIYPKNQNMSEKSNSIKIACITSHFGEEPVLTGTKGAGAIFLSGCNLRCVFCQNWQISQRRLNEKKMTPYELAVEMLRLQELGCHNIDLVSPSHQVKSLRLSIRLAKEQGLTIPVVYNTNSMDNLDALRSLEGLVDIYLPDLKYSNDCIARDLSTAHSYVSKSRAAISEMYRQVGNLETDEDGIAVKGLIVRHLVLPNGLSGSEESLTWLTREVSPEVAVGVMSQYYPTHRALEYPKLSRRITRNEYLEVVHLVEELRLENGWLQGIGSAEHYRPDFRREKDPFGDSSQG